jgi:formylmethanofuran dehydrogenase subunit E
MTLTHGVSPTLTSALEQAAEFHGHLGPFLAIGVRMGLIGLKKIGGSKSNQLVVTAALPLRVPFSCIIDGLQVSTSCTVGNQKLSLEDSPTIQARFRRKDNGQEIVIALDRSVFEKMKNQLLREAVSEDEIRKLAWIIVSIPEDELFEITSNEPT